MVWNAGECWLRCAKASGQLVAKQEIMMSESYG